MVHSKIVDEVVAGNETTYGTLASTFTLALGAIESFSYTENENVQPINGVGNGWTPIKNEDGLYHVSGSLVSKPTKSSLPVLLEYFFGNRVDATDYTVIDSTTIKSMSFKAQHTPTQTVQITGAVFTNINIEASKDGFLVISLDYIAKKLTVATETVTYTQPTDSVFMWVDTYGTWGGSAVKANAWTITGDWNIDPNDGRGLESVAAGERRLIQRVIKNNLTLGGSADLLVDGAISELGYADERTDKTLVFTVSRGTDNQHDFTLSGCRTNNKSSDEGSEAGIKNLTFDIASALDISIAGDL